MLHPKSLLCEILRQDELQEHTKHFSGLIMLKSYKCFNPGTQGEREIIVQRAAPRPVLTMASGWIKFPSCSTIVLKLNLQAFSTTVLNVFLTIEIWAS